MMTFPLTRLHGWAPRGERLVDKVPQGKWKTATFLAALRNDRIEAPCVFDGPINGERFRAYVEQFLIPTLKPNDIVVLDNLGSHKGKAVRKAVKAAGARYNLGATGREAAGSYPDGMRKLLHKCRIRFSLTRSRFSFFRLSFDGVSQHQAAKATQRRILQEVGLWLLQ
jgi:hypothetical protein